MKSLTWHFIYFQIPHYHYASFFRHKMTLLTSSSGKRFHIFFINNVNQLNSKRQVGFTPAGFYTLTPARQLSTVPVLRSRYYSPAASAKQFSRSKGINANFICSLK